MYFYWYIVPLIFIMTHQMWEYFSSLAITINILGFSLMREKSTDSIVLVNQYRFYPLALEL